MTKRKKFPIGTLILFGLFLLVMLVTYLLVRPPTPPPELEGVLRKEFSLLMPFELTDHSGTVFNNKRLQGKWTFVFFGYTYCVGKFDSKLHNQPGRKLVLRFRRIPAWIADHPGSQDLVVAGHMGMPVYPQIRLILF